MRLSVGAAAMPTCRIDPIRQPDRAENAAGSRVFRMLRPIFHAVLLVLAAAALAACGHTPTPTESAAACLADLDAHDVVYRPLDMGEPKDPRCRVPAPIKLSRIDVRIDHLGAYSCRAVSGHDKLSEHAYGLAIDISGFRLSDGTSVSVERDWARSGPKSTFLHHAARAACGYFSVVLTPDSNADHFNHFHLDLGPSRLCSV